MSFRAPLRLLPAARVVGGPLSWSVSASRPFQGALRRGSPPFLSRGLSGLTPARGLSANSSSAGSAWVRLLSSLTLVGVVLCANCSAKADEGFASGKNEGFEPNHAAEEYFKSNPLTVITFTLTCYLCYYFHRLTCSCPFTSKSSSVISKRLQARLERKKISSQMCSLFLN